MSLKSRLYQSLSIATLLVTSIFIILIGFSIESEASNPKAVIVGENARLLYNAMDDSLKRKAKSPTNLGEPIVYKKEVSALVCAAYTRMSWVKDKTAKTPSDGKWIKSTNYICDLRENLSQKQLSELYKALKSDEVSSLLSEDSKDKKVANLWLTKSKAETQNGDKLLGEVDEEFKLSLITQGKDWENSEDMEMTLVITGDEVEALYRSMNVKAVQKHGSNMIDPLWVKTAGTLTCEHFYPHYAEDKFTCTVKGKRKK
jgi:hypothetical protein